jgi:hypothetical protein
MNSPPDPGSPSPTTPSSGSPPPDEYPLPPSSSQIEQTSMFLSSPTSGKRTRNAPTSSRDAKTRRRDDPGQSSTGRRAGHGYGRSQESGRQKDDLVDSQLVEILKRRESFRF